MNKVSLKLALPNFVEALISTWKLKINIKLYWLYSLFLNDFTRVYLSIYQLFVQHYTGTLLLLCNIHRTIYEVIYYCFQHISISHWNRCLFCSQVGCGFLRENCKKSHKKKVNKFGLETYFEAVVYTFFLLNKWKFLYTKFIAHK